MSRRRSMFGPVTVAALMVLATGAITLSNAFAATTSPADVNPLAATAGCGKAPTLTSGTRSVQSNGKSRSFILRIPDNYDSNHQYRLIFAFHWVGGTANDVASGGTDKDAWAYYGLMQLSSNSAILVAPQGLNNGWGNSGGEDVTFVDDMIKQIEGDLCVDTAQLFSVGFSYGGAMTYALACARATVFRAVAVYSGGQLSGCSGGTQPIAYLGIHGISDSVLGISGGRAMRDTFVRNNGCTAQSPPEPKQGSLTHITTAYSGCGTGYPVKWAAFDGGHTPGPVDGGGDSGARTWTKGEVWNFFSQFQSSQPSTSPSSARPSSSSPSSSSPSSSSPGSAGCGVGYTVNAWSTGLTASITITNTGSTTINGWSLAFTLPTGQTITSGWNATYSPSSGTVTATNVSYNGAIAAGGSTSIGFQATHTGNTAKPTSFTLNGAACAIA
jgi:poly(3-hydroxybutyrate) depolymerase